MAARIDPLPQGPELVDLRQVDPPELDPLLLEESVEWNNLLHWDFARSAELIRHYAAMRALNGTVMRDRGEVAAYGYSVLEEHKGLIGDLYVRPAWRTGETEVKLFRSLLDYLIETPHVSRIESQLMLVGSEIARAIQRERFVRLYERILLSWLPQSAARMQARVPPSSTAIEPWSDYHMENASASIALSYNNHVDSQINDQYRSLGGSRRFLHNLVEFPGCGMFYRPGCFVAVERQSRSINGIVLASFVAAEVGHITQISVVPKLQGSGLGYELLRRSMEALVQKGAQRITLTVTAGNPEALRLYERCGFEEVRRFYAYVWEKY